MDQVLDESVLFQSHDRSIKLKTTSITVNAGEEFEVPVSITKPGTILKWVFQSRDYDIEFSITKRVKEEEEVVSDNSNDEDTEEDSSDSDDEYEDVFAPKRYAPNTLHEGQLVLEKNGVYHLTWDNSYSWMREKHVVYSVEIIYPEATVMELRRPCLDILHMIEEDGKVIEECKTESSTIDNELIELHSTLQQKEELLLSLKQEIETIKSTIKEKNAHYAETVATIERKKQDIQDMYAIMPFVLQGPTIFSYLTGKDLIQLCCVNRMLHKAIHQDYIWHSVFLQESDNNLAILLKNSWLLQKWKLFRSDVPVPVYKKEEAEQPIEEVEQPTEEVELPTEEVEQPTEEVEQPTEEAELPTEDAVDALQEKPTTETQPQPEEPQKPSDVEQSIVIETLEQAEENPSDQAAPEPQEPTSADLPIVEDKVPIASLKLKYSIRNNEGWYINDENLCYYVYVDKENHQSMLWTQPIPLEELDELHKKTERSNVLIACPGTVQGESGFYIDRHRKVTKWVVDDHNNWTEIQFF